MEAGRFFKTSLALQKPNYRHIQEGLILHQYLSGNLRTRKITTADSFQCKHKITNIIETNFI
jgi:hypothetical protein